MDAKPFSFATEFAADGQVLSGADAAYVTAEEARAMCDQARIEAADAAKAADEARAADALAAIAAHLTPVPPVLSEVANQLKREAVELAIAAAKTIAGKALDQDGAKAAAEAVGEIVGNLKDGPTIVATVAPDTAELVAQIIGRIGSQDVEARISVKEDAAAKPGDWRVEWGDGAVEFDREAAAAAVEEALARRMNDPAEPQLDLFEGAAA